MRAFQIVITKNRLTATTRYVVKKGKKKKKKIKSLSNRQISKKPVHIDLKIIFIVGQRKVSTGRQLQFSQTWILELINFYWLTYTKKVKDKMYNS